VLLAAFRADWIARGQSPLTVDAYLNIVRPLVNDDEDPPTLAQARTYISDLLGRRTSQTALFHTRALKAYSRWWAAEMDEPDPFARLKFPKAHESPAMPIAADADIDKILANNKSFFFRQRRATALIVLMRDTGARRSEISRLNVTDINLDEGYLQILQTKNRRPRIVPLSPDLRTALLKYLTARRHHKYVHDDALFIGKKGRLRPDTLGNTVRALADAAGVKITCHTFRRRMAYQWAAKGGTDDALQLVCGWKSPRMPARYRQGLAQNLADDQFRRIVGGSVST